MYQVIEYSGVNYSNKRYLSTFNTEAEANQEATKLHNLATSNVDEASRNYPNSNFFNDKMYSVDEVGD